MTFMTMFMVYGEPVGKGRPRFAKRGNFVSTYTPQKTKTYEDEIRMMASAAMGSKQSSYESIATTTVGSGGTATITFSSIPATYTHLQIRGITNSSAGGGSSINMQVGNGSIDTGSNYAWHQIYGDGTSPGASAGTTQTSIRAIAYDSGTPTSFSGFVIDILDYANISKYKTTRTLTGVDTNSASGIIVFRSGLWQSTSAINTITFTPTSGNLIQYSQFALFGIKGA